jgi:tetratricopeptide (TPR) repeat protein
LFEREKMAEILSEHDLYKRGAGIDAATTRQLRLHGVDALIFGVVDAYSITDQRGTSAVEKKLGTGRFRKVAYKDPKTGETKYKDEEIMRTVLWNRPYILRQGSVGVTFRMANIVTGEIVAVEAMTSNFSEKAWKDEIDRKLPAKDAILDSLATEVVRKFLNKIQPHTVKASIALEATGGQHNKLGILYARNGLWDKALDEFEIARQGEHANPSAHYNSGMVYYVLGDYANAVSLVEQAIAIEPKRKYVRALAMIRSLSYE